MDKAQCALSLTVGVVLFVMLPSCGDLQQKIITSINDSGKANPSKLKLKAPVYNAWPNTKGIM